MLGDAMERIIRTPEERRASARCAVGIAAALLAAAPAARAQEQAPQPGSCAAAIRAVLTDIAARDLDTSAGPPLNAFLTLNPSAIAQADALDRRAAAGDPRGALFCVPVAVKDNFNTYDMPTTVGSLALIGNQPPADAPFVARLRDAGAVIVGKTNMDEFAMGIRGLSGAGGRVGNAYDTTQSAGGSSSGSAAAVGTGYVPFALGSDNCGSLRLPAVYNGAVTLRASTGTSTPCGSTRCSIPWTAAAARAATNRPTSPVSSPAPPDCPQQRFRSGSMRAACRSGSSCWAARTATRPWWR